MSTPDFRELQRAFAAHLRDPAHNPAPTGIEDRRLAIYRDLFFNNVENFLGTFFPVLRSLYGADDWLDLVRSYFALHHSETPYFLEIAGEFLAYLEREHVARACDPPYLLELAQYEWLELALDVAIEEIPGEGYDPAGDLLAGVPMVSPLAVLVRYGWPVQHISAAHRDLPPADTFLMIYRNRADQVRFLELNAVAARLFAELNTEKSLPAAQRRSGRALALAIAAELGHGDPEAVVAGAREMLQSWRERDIILGTLDSRDAAPAAS